MSKRGSYKKTQITPYTPPEFWTQETFVPAVFFIDVEQDNYKYNEPQQIPPEYKQCKRCSTYHLIIEHIYCQNCKEILTIKGELKCYR